MVHIQNCSRISTKTDVSVILLCEYNICFHIFWLIKINLINGNCDLKEIMASLTTGLESLNLGATQSSSQTSPEADQQKTGFMQKQFP